MSQFIDASEKALIQSLETFFKKVYSEDQLISHGLDHHRRVWEYAKELLHYIENKENIINQDFVKKLLIACYLHDIGMSLDTGKRHGRYSREICREFLRENNLNESDYHDLLQAIENHDNKDYCDNITIDSLLTILSVADDLDAFGETGISRYLEIYNERGIQAHLIATAILENARKRFENFEKKFAEYPSLVSKYKIKYLILYDFFKSRTS